MDPVVILPACGRYHVHGKHSWRHGFLHLFKITCEGFNLYQHIKFEDVRKKQWTYLYQQNDGHKHKMFLSRSLTTDSVLVFICDAHTIGCNFRRDITRGLWNRQTINGYRMRMARLSCEVLFEEIHKDTWL